MFKDLFNVAKWHCGKGTNKSATSCVEIADAERLTSFCSECDGSVTHARGSSEGSQGCREDADDDLNDGLPSFLFHSVFHLKVRHSRFRIQEGEGRSLVGTSSFIPLTSYIAQSWSA